VKGDGITSEEEWLEINQPLVFGTVEPLSQIDRAVAFGDVQLSYENEPFATLLKTIATNAVSLRSMERNPALAGLAPGRA